MLSLSLFGRVARDVTDTPLSLVREFNAKGKIETSYYATRSVSENDHSVS